MPPIPQPYVLTLRLDTAAEKLLTGLRAKYFPSHRNFLAAHVTLFHALPAASQPTYERLLSTLSTTTSPFTVGIKNPFMLGKKGVGINIASHRLREMHKEMQQNLWDAGVELTEQDQSTLSAHVTVQNKVGHEEAEKTLGLVKEEFKDQAGKAVGLVVWRYEVNGEWTKLKEFDFKTGS